MLNTEEDIFWLSNTIEETTTIYHMIMNYLYNMFTLSQYM